MKIKLDDSRKTIAHTMAAMWLVVLYLPTDTLLNDFTIKIIKNIRQQHLCSQASFLFSFEIVNKCVSTNSHNRMQQMFSSLY